MIRRATSDDIEAIEQMDRVCFPIDKPYFFTWDKNVSWVICNGASKGADDLVGYISAHPLRNGVWFFSRVGVMPSHAVAGGRAKRAKPLGSPGVQGITRIQRHAAGVMCWRAIGFQAMPFRQRRGLDGDSVHLA